MNNQPLVSILIPVYNRENLIMECIKSAVSQTYKNIEIIIVDNHSEDNTWKICNEFAKKDSRIKVYRNDNNLGPVLNWKKCINYANGVFGKILFSDDTITPDFIEKSVALLVDNEVGFCFSIAVIGEDMKTGNQNYLYRKFTQKVDSRKYIFDSLTGVLPLVSPGAALFRLNDLRVNLVDLDNIFYEKYNKRTDFNAHGAGPDVLIYLLTANTYKYIGYINEPMAFFRRHDGSITIADSKKEKKLTQKYQQAKQWFAEEYNYTNMLSFRYKIIHWPLKVVISRSILKIKCILKEFI